MDKNKQHKLTEENKNYSDWYELTKEDWNNYKKMLKQKSVKTGINIFDLYD